MKSFLLRNSFLATITGLAILYTALALSPSSYALVLESFGVAESGVVLGRPQEIRSDEFALWTPTVQALVKTGFSAVNGSSLYEESFRTLSSMPIADWGLIFKPHFWAFLALPPAYAYALHFAVLYWLFLAGWYLFLSRLGVDRRSAAAAAVLLLACSWTQMWWTSFGSILAVAPLLPLLALRPLADRWRFLGALYLTAFLFLSGFFYPPLIFAVLLVLFAAVFAFRPEVVKPAALAPIALGCAAGLALAGLYLWEPILAMAGTAAHGKRNLGGGGVPWQDWLSNFLPSFSFRGWQPLHGINACEASAGGSILLLLAAAFGRRGAPLDPATRRRLLGGSAALGALLVFSSLWMLAPVPAIFGKPLLWHLMPATRLLLLPGLAALLLALLWLPWLELRFSPGRALLAAGLLALSAGAAGFAELGRGSDAWLIPLLLLPPLLAWRERARPAAPGLAPWTLVATAALGNLLLFGGYNPLQSSRPIFAEHRSPELDALRAMAAADPRGWLVAGGYDRFGSVLNGLGFRAVNHSLLVPQLPFFERVFPSLEPSARDFLFNRYANIQLAPLDGQGEPLEQPELPLENAVLVPAEPFLPPLSVELRQGLPAAAPAPAPAPAGAATRLRWVKKRRVELEVLSPHGFAGVDRVTVSTAAPVTRLLGHWRVPLPGPVAETDPEPLRVLVLRFSMQNPPAGEAAAASAPEAAPVDDFQWCVTLAGPSFAWQVGPAPEAGVSICPPAAAAGASAAGSGAVPAPP